MSSLSKIASATGNFLTDYCQRHKHPVNAVLHLFGVPMVFVGLFDLFKGQFAAAGILIVLGYFLQYLGHKAQGNEVGEVTLIKNIWRRLAGDRS